MKSTPPSDVRSLIRTWPKIDDLAADLGVKPTRVEKWRQFNRIPLPYQHAVVRFARARGVLITHEWMLERHAKAELVLP